MAYRVTAPFVYLKVKDPVIGSYAVQGFYEGAVVDDVDEDNLKHHLDLGMVEEVGARVAVSEPVDKDQSAAKRPSRSASHG